VILKTTNTGSTTKEYKWKESLWECPQRKFIIFVPLINKYDKNVNEGKKREKQRKMMVPFFHRSDDQEIMLFINL